MGGVVHGGCAGLLVLSTLPTRPASSQQSLKDALACKEIGRVLAEGCVERWAHCGRLGAVSALGGSWRAHVGCRVPHGWEARGAQVVPLLHRAA